MRLALWLAAGLAMTAAAQAQGPAAGKALSGEAAKGALMGRDELRACIVEQTAQGRQAEALERRRLDVSQQAAAARQQLADVQAERMAFGGWQRAVQALNQRIEQHGQRVSQFNQRVKAFQESRPTAAGAERERGQIEAEAEALAQADAALKADGAQLDANVAQARAGLTTRAQAQASAASAANAANTQFNADAQAFEAARTDWLQRCGGRPYLVADEQAIRAELR